MVGTGVGGPVWALAFAGMFLVMIVVFVRQLRRTSDGPGPLIAAGVVVLLVLVGILLLFVTGVA